MGGEKGRESYAACPGRSRRNRSTTSLLAARLSKNPLFRLLEPNAGYLRFFHVIKRVGLGLSAVMKACNHRPFAMWLGVGVSIRFGSLRRLLKGFGPANFQHGP